MKFMEDNNLDWEKRGRARQEEDNRLERLAVTKRKKKEFQLKDMEKKIENELKKMQRQVKIELHRAEMK